MIKSEVLDMPEIILSVNYSRTLVFNVGYLISSFTTHYHGSQKHCLNICFDNCFILHVIRQAFTNTQKSEREKEPLGKAGGSQSAPHYTLRLLMALPLREIIASCLPSVPGPCEPEDLIDGIIFAANYLGSTQLLSERNPSKNIRMMQAQEAVSRVKVGDVFDLWTIT